MIQYRNVSKTLLIGSKERYLRDDIPCGSQLCTRCKGRHATLPSEAQYYVIPDKECLQRFLECYEDRDFSDGLIILSSVLSKVPKGKIRLLSRIRSLYNDKRRPIYLFDDLHHVELFDEDYVSLKAPMAAALWYSRHLGLEQKVVILSDVMVWDQCSTSPLHAEKNLEEMGIQFMDPKEYFSVRWAKCDTIVNAFESILVTKDGTGLPSKAEISKAEIEKRLQSGRYIKGEMLVDLSRPNRAIVTMNKGKEEESIKKMSLQSEVILEGKSCRGRALHGDEVIIEILKDHLDTSSSMDDEEDSNIDPLTSLVDNEQVSRGLDHGVYGRVVAVSQRNSIDLIATISSEDERALKSVRAISSQKSQSVICIPFDRRFPKMRLRSKNLANLIGKRLFVRITGWPEDSNYPEVHILQVMGDVGNLKTETDTLLFRHGLLFADFSNAAKKELPKISGNTWVPSQDIIDTEIREGRIDLSDEFIVSVDPPGCTDVDDAFHIKMLNEKEFQLGIHIADVSYFVQEGSVLDEEAAERCTTVYLVDRRLNMLPEEISEDAASLLCKRTRFAMSVLWTINLETWRIEKIWYGRTIINSRYQLEYGQAQNILEGNSDLAKCGLDSHSDRNILAFGLKVLRDFTESRRRARLQSGAIEMESKELSFKTNDETGSPQEVQVKSSVDMMSIVAELMILANQQVATKIRTVFPRIALVRCHTAPDKGKLSLLQSACFCFLKAQGIDNESQYTLFERPEDFGADLRRVYSEIKDSEVRELLKGTANRALSEARYICAGSATSTQHFGLGIDIYTHFTSPIRRYADIVVHRQLLCALREEQLNEFENSTFQETVERMNSRQRASKIAQRECSLLYLLILLLAKPEVHRAVVRDIQFDQQITISVFIPYYGIEVSSFE